MKFKQQLCSLLFFSLVNPFIIFSQGDECAGALNIPNVSNFCSAPGAYTNVGSTSSTFPNPPCWTAVNGDVWFQFTAGATDVSITVNGNISGNGTLNRPQVELYFGDCAGILNYLVCGSAANGVNTINAYKGGLTIGQVYYIRVSSANNSKGTFQMCINNYTPASTPGQDCITASYLCNKNPVTIANFTGAGADNREAAGTCMQINPTGPVEANTTWFTWVADNNGTLTFTLNPTKPDDDLDFALFDISSGCASKTLERCNAAGGVSNCWGLTGLNLTSTDISEPIDCPPTNDKFVKYLDMIAGKTYALLVENFSSANQGFTISFGGTGNFLGPKPDFTPSATSLCMGAPLTFTDNSIGALSYSWDFGSGATPATSSVVGPHSVSYSTIGTKTIVLTVTGKGGCPVTSVKTVNVQNCTSNVTATGGVACPNGCANIVAAASSGTAPYTFTWSSGQAGAGPFNVCPTTTTIYTVTVTDQNGATNTDTTMVKIYPAITLATSNTPANCTAANGSATVAPSGGTQPYTYTWSSLNGTNSTLNTIPTGIYTVTVTDSKGCTSTASVTVPALGAATVSAVTVPVSCFGGNNGSATATGSGGATPYIFSWSTSPVQTGITVNNLKAGTYTVTIKDGTGCTSSTVTTVTEPPVLVLTTSKLDAVCGKPNGSVTVSVTSGGNAPYTYTWSPTSGTTATLAGIPAGTYVVTVTDNNGCTKTASQSLTSSIGPKANFSVPSQCVNTSFAFTNSSTGAISYTWDFGDSSPKENTQNPSHIYTAPGTYTGKLVVADANGCSDSSTVSIVVSTLPQVAFGDSAVGCSPLQVTFNNLSDPGIYAWDFGNGTSTEINPVVTYINTTSVPLSYTIKLNVASNGCSNSLSKLNYVTVYPNPKVVFTMNPAITEILSPEVHFYNQTTGGVLRMWYFGDGDSSQVNNPVHTYKDTGTYTVCLDYINSNNCPGRLCGQVIIKPIWSFYIPNAFTPNGDGINDTFNGAGDNIHSYELLIFDRWGDMIFKSNSLNVSWDGKANGGSSMAQQDVYVYVVNLIDVFDKKHKYVGSVTLLK